MHGRQYIRHPVSIPIEAIETGVGLQTQSFQAFSVGQGGLAFHCAHTVAPGTLIHLRIPYVEPEFESDARVVWCRECESDAELGVEFLNSDDAFRVRMVEQVCHIENYRREIQAKEGRALSAEEAASEWIRKFAAMFPNSDRELN